LSQTIQLDFRELRGVKTQKKIDGMDRGDAYFCVGGLFTKDSSFIKRKGGEKYNTTSLGDSGTGLYDYRYNGGASSKLLASAGTTLNAVTTSTITAIKTGLTDGAFLDFETYKDYCFFCNGNEALFKYNGTTVTNAGITRPATSPTGASAGGGSLPVGDYLVGVTFVNDSDPDNIIESNDCDEITVTVAGSAISLTNIPVSSDPQVTKRYIYVSDAGQPELYYNSVINDNSTTTLTITDESTGALLEYDHDTPPDGLGGIELFKDCLWGFKGNTVYFTKAFFPWYWPQGGLQGELDDEDLDFSFEVGNGEPIVGLKAFGKSALLIFKKNAIYTVVGNTDLDFTLGEIRNDEQIGAMSGRCIKVLGNYCYFLGESSVYRTDGNIIQDVGQDLQGFFDNTFLDSTYNISKSNLDIACMEYFGNNNALLLFVPASGETTNNLCFYADTNSFQWCPHPGFTTQAVATVRNGNETSWFRIDDNGYIFEQEALDGDGSNVTSTSTGSNTDTTVNDTNQSWTTNLYAGLRFTCLSGTGAGQESIIVSNTATQLVLSPALDVTLDSTSVYTIGGPPFHYQHSYDDYGDRGEYKRLIWIRPIFESTGDYSVNIYHAYDGTQGDLDNFTIDVSSLSLFDVSLFDVATWDGSKISQDKYRCPSGRIHMLHSYKIENNAAGQPIIYNGAIKEFQIKGSRKRKITI